METADALLLANAKDNVLAAFNLNTGDSRLPFLQEPVTFTVSNATVLCDDPTVADWNADGVADLVGMGESPTGARRALRVAAARRRKGFPIDNTGIIRTSSLAVSLRSAPGVSSRGPHSRQFIFTGRRKPQSSLPSSRRIRGSGASGLAATLTREETGRSFSERDQRCRARHS